jgi:hypothetical protein
VNESVVVLRAGDFRLDIYLVALQKTAFLLTILNRYVLFGACEDLACIVADCDPAAKSFGRGLLGKRTKKSILFFFKTFLFVIHNVVLCGQIIRLWVNFKKNCVSRELAIYYLL